MDGIEPSRTRGSMPMLTNPVDCIVLLAVAVFFATVGYAFARDNREPTPASWWLAVVFAIAWPCYQMASNPRYIWLIASMSVLGIASAVGTLHQIRRQRQADATFIGD
jgi:hypothetical protein